MNINLYVLPAEPDKTSESNTYTRLHCSMKILSKIMSSYSTLLKRELANVFFSSQFTQQVIDNYK